MFRPIMVYVNLYIRHALKLLNPIGEAELQKEIQRTVKKISESKEIANITTETSLELDEEELEKYLEM